jgi:hypothetical protein
MRFLPLKSGAGETFRKIKLQNQKRTIERFNMSATKEQEIVPKSVQTRQIKVGKWNESLKKSDVNQIWTELHRIVSSHPLVRASKRAGFLVEEGRHNAYTDLTQELFVALLGKERFAHYIDTGMTDAEVEAEISQIELTNMLTAELRKRYPESYRLARRVSTLIQTGKTFKRFDNINNPDVHRRLADRLYGLAEWKNEKTRRNVQEMEERVKTVSFRAAIPEWSAARATRKSSSATSSLKNLSSAFSKRLIRRLTCARFVRS